MRTSNHPGSGCRERSVWYQRKPRPVSGFCLWQCFIFEQIMYFSCSRATQFCRLGDINTSFSN